MNMEFENKFLNRLFDRALVHLVLRKNVKTWSTFRRLFGIGLWFTPFGQSARLLAGGIAVRFQIVHSRHQLVHASAPRALFVSASCTFPAATEIIITVINSIIICKVRAATVHISCYKMSHNHWFSFSFFINTLFHSYGEILLLNILHIFAWDTFKK